MLLLAPVHIRPVNKSRESIVLLPHFPAAHWRRADKVEAGGSEVDPGEESVPGRDRNSETFRVTQIRLRTTIKAF